MLIEYFGLVVVGYKTALFSEVVIPMTELVALVNLSGVIIVD